MVYIFAVVNCLTVVLYTMCIFCDFVTLKHALKIFILTALCINQQSVYLTAPL